MNAVQCYEGDGIAPPHSLSLAEAKCLKRGDRVFHSVARGKSFVIAAVEDAYDKHGRVTKVLLWVNSGEDGSAKYVVPYDTWLCKDAPE